MLKLGITGGIGSGKTLVSRIFEVLGIPVYYADAEAKKLMSEDADLRERLSVAFGPQTYETGELNRVWLSAQVFGNEEKLKTLNNIVHPAVLAHGAQWMKKQNGPYVIKEAALIFESGSASGLDYVIGVYAPEAVRIQRVMYRDGLGRNDVLARMNKQLDETIKMKLCDFVLVNDEQKLLTTQVTALHLQLLELTKTA